MQKINKKEILSKEYEKWLNNLRGKNHPKYNSSNFKYYLDIKMSLLYVQNGLCAYTEQSLCDEDYFKTDNWDDKKYIKKLTQEDKNSIQGDLEHFDESLKTNQGWLWDNFFVVTTHNNCRIKGSKPIEDILKPDDINYDPYKYLEFDFETGVFIANTNLPPDEKEKVKYMIETLGINCIYNQRKKYLNLLNERIDIGLEAKPYEYITAWNMTLKSLEDK